MHGTCTTGIRLHVREVSVGQLADLWSVIMARLPEVRRSNASFVRRGQSVDETYDYDDAEELAHADLDVRPGELSLSFIDIVGPDTKVFIVEGWPYGPSNILLLQSSWLQVDITGPNERDVVALRVAVERWAERNLDMRRLGLWLKSGVLVAGVGAASVAGAVSDQGASEALRFGLMWVAAFKCLEALQVFVPALGRRTLHLWITNGVPPGGGRHGAQAPGQPEPNASARTDADARARHHRNPATERRTGASGD